MRRESDAGLVKVGLIGAELEPRAADQAPGPVAGCPELWERVVRWTKQPGCLRETELTVVVQIGLDKSTAFVKITRRCIRLTV